MKQSTLNPFLRKDLDILFVGLNPALGSSEKGHYFSVNQAFWNQFYSSGLITESIDKETADDVVFGSTRINYHHWTYGIMDLVPEWAESDSQKIRPLYEHCKALALTILEYRPKVATIIHNKSLKPFLSYLGELRHRSNEGYLGCILPGSQTVFYAIAFPHGNNIPSNEKIENYRKVKEFLLQMKN